MVPVGGDSRALEENSVINVVIVDSDGYVVGNADPYYGQIQITFIEDDGREMLYVDVQYTVIAFTCLYITLSFFCPVVSLHTCRLYTMCTSMLSQFLGMTCYCFLLILDCRGICGFQ